MVITQLKFAGAVSLTLFVAGIVGWLSYVSLASGQPVAPTTGRSEVMPIASVLLGNEAEETWPKGWGGGSNQPGEYEVRVDRSVAHAGQASGSVRSLVANPNGFGSLTQSFKADDFRGKRLRLSGYIKVKDVSDGAGLWMRIDSENKTVAFDNMDKRSLKGTGDWKKCAIVLDVPADSARITFGMLMKGSGQAWVDDLKFEAVGNDVASTNLLEKEIPIPGLQGTVPDKPANLDFEEKN